MITITGKQEIADCDIYPDDSDNLMYYVCPQGPKIAVDDKGKPIFSLVWYRRDVSKLTDDQRKTMLGGGILACSVELATTADQDKAIRAALAGDAKLQAATKLTKDKLATQLKFGALPVSDGSVTIAILGEGPGGAATPATSSSSSSSSNGSSSTPPSSAPPPAASEPAAGNEFTGSIIGVGGVSMTGSERASFMAKLTQDGVVLLWDMVTKNLPSIRVAYDLTFNYRVEGVEMRVWCDGSKVFNAIQDQYDKLHETGSFSDSSSGFSTSVSAAHAQSDTAADKLFTWMGSSESAGVSVVPSAGADVVKPDLITTLTDQGNDMIKDFLAATFLEPKVGDDFKPDDQPTLSTALPQYQGQKYGSDSIDNYNLKSFTQGVSAKLDYRMKEKAVVEGHARPNDNLGNVLNGHKVDDFRVQIDIDDAFYRYLDVMVTCTADFDNDPIAAVKAHLAYQGTGPYGAINSVGDFLFQKGAIAPQRFSTYLASADANQYKWSLEVVYKGTAATYTTSGQGNETILILDVDKLGILHVDVAAGIVDWTNIQEIQVDMSYGSGHQTEFILTAQQATHTWVEVIASPVTQPYSYTVTFVDKTGQRLVQDAVQSSSKQIVVDQPETQTLEVILIAAGNFGGSGLIGQIAVAMQYIDAPNNVNNTNEFVLKKNGDSAIWSVPLVNQQLRTYQYKTTVFYTDGITREDVWHTSDDNILPVGDPFGYEVRILPYLFHAPWAFGTVELKYDDDPGAIHTDTTLEIKDFTTPLTWPFRIGAPDRHTYQYQLTMYTLDGKQVVVPWTQETKQVLVLIPPPLPAGTAAS